jgi:hypothetical protein
MFCISCRLIVNFRDASDDTVMHLNPRISQGKIVLNHFQGGKWGTEELLPIGPIRVGMPFDILILVENDLYKVALNGQHHGEFRHRLPKDTVVKYDMSGFQVNYVKAPGRDAEGTMQPVSEGGATQYFVNPVR